jgi:hypothetical protein
MLIGLNVIQKLDKAYHIFYGGWSSNPIIGCPRLLFKQIEKLDVIISMNYIV